MSHLTNIIVSLHNLMQSSHKLPLEEDTRLFSFLGSFPAEDIVSEELDGACSG